MIRTNILVRALLIGWALSVSRVSESAPPRMLFQGKSVKDFGEAGGTRTAFALMRMHDGSFAFYNRNDPAGGPLTLTDARGLTHTLLPYLPPRIVNSNAISESGVLSNTQVILTPQNDVKSVYVQSEQIDKQTAARVGLPRYLNVWIKQSGLTDPAEPKMIWRGYNGSQMEYQQLPNGRILVPFGSFQPHAKAIPPTGRNKTIIQYSDDDGRTWSESESKLVSPCYQGFNGSNEGACEPAIERLSGGRIWMLFRTQAGFLYESWSDDNGTKWHKAMPSRFNTSTGPPNIMRHKNGWLVVCWNNCEMPPRHQGQGVYGGRDALHIAVSTDEGKTWRGFREIYLDHRRHDNPARAGDRGTAYPLGAYTSDGMLVVLAGQGEGGRNPILIDPQWIIETKSATDFSDGLKQWSVYKHFGPAKRWWRARAVGCELVPNPTDANTKSLHLRKADELPADSAVWNFPNGWKGKLTARIMIRKGFHGATISLNDRMFDPTNDYGEQFAVFGVDIGNDGKLGDAVLRPGKWYDITFLWDLSKNQCQLQVDGVRASELRLRNPTLNGMSYVRFRSAARELDTAGFLVDHVDVSINDPYAPLCSLANQLAQEQRYVQKMTPLWRKHD